MNGFGIHKGLIWGNINCQFWVSPWDVVGHLDQWSVISDQFLCIHIHCFAAETKIKLLKSLQEIWKGTRESFSLMSWVQTACNLAEKGVGSCIALSPSLLLAGAGTDCAVLSPVAVKTIDDHEEHRQFPSKNASKIWTFVLIERIHLWP